MAIIKPNQQISGRIGDIVFYSRHGHTYVRHIGRKPAKSSRTPAQMASRINWRNLASLWKRFPADMRPHFEGRRPGVGNFNCFIAENLSADPVYLPADMAAQGGCVATPLLLSRGTLATILTQRDDQGLLTNIVMGDFRPSPDSTLGQFSAALVGNNVHFRHGDILTFLLAEQSTDAATATPTVQMTSRSLLLDPDDSTLLSTLVGDSPGFAVRGGRLASDANPLGGMAWIHRRYLTGLRHPEGDGQPAATLPLTLMLGTGDSHLRVSTQHLICNNQPLLDRYCGDAALAQALPTYDCPAEPQT